MKYQFTLCYELDTPLATAVALYLDCEHYVFLHRGLSSRIEIFDKGTDYYRCHQTWNVFGFKLGQTYTCRYAAPNVFLNDDIRPYPSWLPSIYHLIKVKTTLRYYGNFERTTTLSELTVELNLPFLLYPFRKRIQDVIEKVKILKDLEDVALFDRRAKLFGRDSNEVYLKRHQFLLHKEDYVKYFSESCSFLGEPAEVQKNETWTNIKNLDRDYVKKFLKEDYHKYTNFENDELAGIIRSDESRSLDTMK